jgi:hypothetical protein
MLAKWASQIFGIKREAPAAVDWVVSFVVVIVGSSEKAAGAVGLVAVS